MEVWIYSHKHGMYSIGKGMEFHASNDNDSDETKYEHNTANQSKEVHWLFAELIEEP